MTFMNNSEVAADTDLFLFAHSRDAVDDWGALGLGMLYRFYSLIREMRSMTSRMPASASTRGSFYSLIREMRSMTTQLQWEEMKVEVSIRSFARCGR